MVLGLSVAPVAENRVSGHRQRGYRL